MLTGLHAIRWGLPRIAIALGITALGALMAYAALVFVIVAVQAFAALGH